MTHPIVISNINSIFSSMTYRFNDTLIDAGDVWEGFYDVSIVLLTHAHFDHIYGLNRVIELNPEVRVYTHECGREMLLDAKKNLSFYHEAPFKFGDPSFITTVKDGEEIAVGEGLTAKSVFTPGHNPSCITWQIDNVLFTGDAYIPGIKIVTNLLGGDKIAATESIDIIKILATERTIFAGHFI